MNQRDNKSQFLKRLMLNLMAMILRISPAEVNTLLGLS